MQLTSLPIASYACFGTSGLQKALNSLADSTITAQVKSTMSQVIQHNAGIMKDDAEGLSQEELKDKIITGEFFSGKS